MSSRMTRLWNFQEHDVVVPITVLRSRTSSKRERGVELHARRGSRRLDELTGDVMALEGVLGEGLGRIRVVLGGLLMECR
ncbi:MAG: hypothetical protein R3B90_19885 [Planctomycetaceae bacterium]